MERSSLSCHYMSALKLLMWSQQSKEVECENKIPPQVLYTSQQRPCVHTKVSLEQHKPDRIPLDEASRQPSLFLTVLDINNCILAYYNYHYVCVYIFFLHQNSSKTRKGSKAKEMWLKKYIFAVLQQSKIGACEICFVFR